jgi:nucleoside-diphosphate-sugar epimerase
MPSAFVTGGTGFVGSHLAEELLGRGYEVRCLVRSEPKWLSGLDVTLVSGSLSRPETLREAVADADFVFHVGGLTRARTWEAFEQANVADTFRLLDVLRERAEPPTSVLVTSSLAAVGRGGSDVADESTPLRPVSLYGRSKAAMEAGLEPYRAAMPLVVVRPPAVYGPRDADVLTFFRSVARGICPIVGRGDVPAVSLVHVHDLVRGMADAAESRVAVGRTYFIGSERPYSWGEVRDATAAVLGRRVVTISVPPPLVPVVGALSEWAGRLVGSYPPLNREKAEEIRYATIMCSSARAAEDFGYSERIPLSEGIAGTLAWYRSQGWL